MYLYITEIFIQIKRAYLQQLGTPLRNEKITSNRADRIRTTASFPTKAALR